MFSPSAHSPPWREGVDSFPSDDAMRAYYVIDDYERPLTATTDKCFGHGGMSNVCRMNDLVAVRHLKLMKLNVLSIKNCCRSCKGKRYMWCPIANDRTIISIASFE